MADQQKNQIYSEKEAAVITESVRQSEALIDKKLRHINWLMAGVVVVLFVAVLTMLFMVATMLLDAWHFNSAVYGEYSEKIETQSTLQKSNEILLEQNKQYQDTIIKQLNHMLEILEK